jgi:hypothetical protein
MIEAEGKFYLGRMLKNGEPFLYDPEDLTTHAVVVGMTGSGKTGLCIDLLEEAALQGIPALLIDPKGDITNTLLQFPDLLSEDFKPWINPDEARRLGLTLEQAAERAAATWKSGLQEWGIPPERLRALKNATHHAIFTPGSDAGIPVSILASLKAPEIPWEGNKELLRERIAATVTAILGLVGLREPDPVRSREHILLSNIFEAAWSQGRDLDLGELILQTQNPPFGRLGVVDVSAFFPDKDRFELAMQLNNILAAPSFQSWIEGQPLDIPALLYGVDGRPRHSVFYIAHLNESERMFFITLLYAAAETWMRAQTGSSNLRAILYFDEVFGYIPPVSNPPSKPLMMRIIKQGRAFGLSQVLVTQNPADLDYKALSNIGTWFIGKLQTENDVARLLDGLVGASPGLDRHAYGRLIASLGKREFLQHNVHQGQPLLFKTRWAMTYLAGPLSRLQLPALNHLAGAFPESLPLSSPEALPTFFTRGSSPVSEFHATPSPAGEGGSSALGSITRPSVPTGIEEYFLSNNLTLSEAARMVGKTLPEGSRVLGIIYRPVLLAQASVRFLQRKYNLEYQQEVAALVTELDRQGTVPWQDWQTRRINPDSLDGGPLLGAVFDALAAPLNDSRILRGLKVDFIDWIYRTVEATVRSNQALEVYAGPEMNQAAFRRACAETARQRMEDEIEKTEASYDRKLDGIEARLRSEMRELERDQAELTQRRMEEMGTHVENVFFLFSKHRRRLSTSLTRRRMTEQAKGRVEESQGSIADYRSQIAALQAQFEGDMAQIKQKWAEISDDMTLIRIPPYKKDIMVDLFGVAWMPYHILEAAGQRFELPGFEP